MLEQARQLQAELIRLRRDIHQHPELGFQEVRTGQLVADTLQEIGGFEIRTGVGKTGVVADLGGDEGPTIAIRADMDALPIQEASEAPYASVNEGVMHACGHDAHTAILLGVAHLLKDKFAETDLPGKVRLLFQPCEEGCASNYRRSGATWMIEDGALEGVDAVIALHVDSTRPLGRAAVKSGWFSANVDSFEAWLVAGGGHGAMPHKSDDPLWMLGPVLMALHGIVARRIDPEQPAVLSVGQVHAGTASNIIPAEVYIEGTLRSFNSTVREQLLAEVERALSVVRPLGGDYRLKINPGYPAGWNNDMVSDWLGTVSREVVGADNVEDAAMGLGAEDFAYMSETVPGAMMMLGAALPDGVFRGHHTNIFDIDEDVLPVGAAILAETARRFLRGEVSLTPDRYVWEIRKES